MAESPKLDISTQEDTQPTCADFDRKLGTELPHDMPGSVCVAERDRVENSDEIPPEGAD